MTSIGPGRRHPSVVLLFGLLMFAALTGSATAAEAPDSVDESQPEVALRLSPAVLEVPEVSGASRHELRVDNLGSEPLTVETELSDFTVTEDGTTEFLGPRELSATGWATLDVDAFELAPGDRRDVLLTVEVPEDAEPGERYLSVIFTVPGEPDGDGNISVTHRVAVKLYIAVSGERIELLDLGELAGPRLIDSGPATFELTLNNQGNVHRRFEEDTQLLATSGDHDFSVENFTVLGDSTRVVEAVWPDPPTFCWCTVEVDVDDGRGTMLTASTRVIAFPVRLSLALVALTVGLAFLAVGRRRRRAACLDRRLEAARQEGADAASEPASAPQPCHPPLGAPERSWEQRPAPPSPPPPPTAPSAPLVHTVSATFKASPDAPAPTEFAPQGATMFTAHSPGDHPRRRRRGR